MEIIIEIKFIDGDIIIEKIKGKKRGEGNVLIIITVCWRMHVRERKTIYKKRLFRNLLAFKVWVLRSRWDCI